MTNLICDRIFLIRTVWKVISLSVSKTAPKKKEMLFTPRPRPDNFSPKSVCKKIVNNWEKEIRTEMEIQPLLQQTLTYRDLCAVL